VPLEIVDKLCTSIRYNGLRYPMKTDNSFKIYLSISDSWIYSLDWNEMCGFSEAVNNDPDRIKPS
jgi:hypothetical protein